MVDATAAPLETPEAVLLTEVGRDLYAASLAGHPTVGAIVGPDSVVLVDATDTPEAALIVAGALKRVTDKPVRKVVLTHYHADATLGAAAFPQAEIITSTLTRGLIADRGRQNRELIGARRAAQGLAPLADVAPVAPTLTFGSSVSLWEGDREVRIMHLGRGHTLGDIVVWVPDAGVMFTGDLTPADRIPDLADGYLRQWPVTLDRIAAFRPLALVPGAGLPATRPEAVDALIAGTRHRLSVFSEAADGGHADRSVPATVARARESLLTALPGVGASPDFETLLLVGASRALAEAAGYDQPDVWSVAREQQAREGLLPESETPSAFAGALTGAGLVAAALTVAADEAAAEPTGVEPGELDADIVAGLEADLADLAAAGEEASEAAFIAEDIVEEAGAPEDLIAAELAEGLADELAGAIDFSADTIIAGDAAAEEAGTTAQEPAPADSGDLLQGEAFTQELGAADLDAVALAVAQAADEVVAGLSDLSLVDEAPAEAGDTPAAVDDLGVEALVAEALSSVDYAAGEPAEDSDEFDDGDFVARFLAATDLGTPPEDGEDADRKAAAESRS